MADKDKGDSPPAANTRATEAEKHRAFKDALSRPQPLTPEMLYDVAHHTPTRPTDHEDEIPRFAVGNLGFYRITGEPLYALAVAELWPSGVKLPQDVQNLLQKSYQALGEAIRAELRRKSPRSLDAGNVLAKALGLKGSRGSKSVFTKMRANWNALKIAEDHEKLVRERGNSEAAVAEIAKSYNMSKPTVWRRIEVGKRLHSELMRVLCDSSLLRVPNARFRPPRRRACSPPSR